MAKKKIMSPGRRHSVALSGGVATSRPPPKAKSDEPPADPPSFRPVAPIPVLEAPQLAAPQVIAAEESAEVTGPPEPHDSPEPAQIPRAAPRVLDRLAALRASNARLDRKLDRLNPSLPRLRD